MNAARSASSSWTAFSRFGATNRSRVRRLGLDQRELELAQHALGHVADDQAGLGRDRRACGKPAAGPAIGPAPASRSDMRSAIGSRMWLKVVRFASAHPARSTTSAGGVAPAGSRPV